MTIADRNRIAGRNQIVGTTAPDHGASTLEHGDDAAHCSNGLNAQRFGDAPPDERAIYQRWLRGAITACVLLALAAGAAVWINGGEAGQTQLTSLSSTSSARSGHAR